MTSNSSGKWNTSENERKFFDTFAASKRFNSLEAEKWYSVSRNELKRSGGGGLLQRYQGSHIKALAKLYPELVLKKENFLKSSLLLFIYLWLFDLSSYCLNFIIFFRHLENT